MTSTDTPRDFANCSYPDADLDAHDHSQCRDLRAEAAAIYLRWANVAAIEALGLDVEVVAVALPFWETDHTADLVRTLRAMSADPTDHALGAS